MIVLYKLVPYMLIIHVLYYTVTVVLDIHGRHLKGILIEI